MAGRRQVRSVADPGGEAEQSADQGGDDADDRTVGDQHEAHVAVGRADGGEHAQRAHAALRQDREAGDGHEADEDQPEDREDQHDDRRVEPALGLRRLCEGAAGERVSGEVADRRVEEDRRVDGSGQLPGRYESEVVEQVLRIGDQPDQLADPTGVGPGVADAQVVGGRQRAGHGDLVRRGRVPAGEQVEHRRAEPAARVLHPQLGALDQTGGQRLVLDDVDRTEALPDGREVRCHGLVGAGEGDQMVGRAEAGVGRRRDVGADGGGQERRRDRDGQQGQHQQLLAPLVTEQPPRPADHGPAGWCGAGRRAGLRCQQVRAHRLGSVSSSDSGPRGVLV